ncbi:serpin family protein [Prevotella sp. kh1p2]|uniref:serpin family protein n=1 Tax=Prevotella sp. kh1p2 TaxID=1761883 RepID=UPI0008C8FE3F|nr:serpin family protein [Prevotella sp. kh1p2]SES86558.1 serpin B [Prevotella sp. kh1p2]SNU11102.1 serpin B [Prevotellaceae bacterium KH2P17]
MKKMFLWALPLLFCVACDNDDPAPDGPIHVEFTQVNQTDYAAAGNKFADKLFNHLAALPDNANGNVTVSPVSMQYLLAMVANGASDEARDEIRKALSMNDFTLDDINTHSSELIHKLPTEDAYVNLELANGAWTDKAFEPKTSFVDRLKASYDAEFGTLDFAQHTADAAAAINKWANDKTHGLIPKVSLDITNETQMVLANAVYFNGKWSNPFDKKDTRDAPFTNEDGTKATVHMMSSELTAPLYQADGLTAVELPYGKGYFSMMLVMPDEGRPIADFNSTFDWWELHQKMNSNVGMIVRLPRFTVINKWKQLVDACKAMGIERIFKEGGLSNLSDTPLAISQICQDIHTAVDESGTKAAAVSTASIDLASPGIIEPPIIEFNRPFLYIIRENTTGTILFMGKIAKL